MYSHTYARMRIRRETLYTVYACLRRRLVSLYPFPFVYEKCGSICIRWNRPLPCAARAITTATVFQLSPPGSHRTCDGTRGALLGSDEVHSRAPPSSLCTFEYGASSAGLFCVICIQPPPDPTAVGAGGHFCVLLIHPRFSSCYCLLFIRESPISYCISRPGDTLLTATLHPSRGKNFIQ